MAKAYRVSYLILEGPWRESPDTGIVEVPRRGGWQDLTCGTARFMAAELVGYALTLESKAGVRIWWTRDRDGTAQMIRQRAAWPDRGRGALMEAAEAAVMPTKLDVILDPRSSERTIIAQSADQPPVAIRLTPFEAEILLERLLVLKRLSGN
jgi:hypothetical protein